LKIKKGENRIVVLLPALNLALKFPRIRLWLALKWAREIFKTPEHWEHYLGQTVHHYGIKRCLFKGIADNWNERRFYHKTGHAFLQPTHCSLFGLCNLQRYGQPVNHEKQSFWINLQEISDYEVTADGHHFYEPANFCLEDGKLRILDYAETRTQEVILKVGLMLQRNYDPNYIYAEESRS
jgi:hypothetical protein